jgi:predicted secreted protein
VYKFKKIKVMTVKELIKVLEKVENQNLKVVVKGVDPTDWVYINMVDEEDVNVENVYDEEIGYRRRLVIDGGMF